MPKKHSLRRILGALVLIAAGMSPFGAYIALKATEPDPTPAWPSNVAVITAENGSLASIAMIHFLAPPTPIIVRFPIETSLNVPGAGSLRAVTAYGIGGAPMLARGLQQTAGVATPFWALWSRGSAAGRPPDSSNLGELAADVVAIIANPSTPVTTAPGTIEVRSGVAYYELDRERLDGELDGTAVAPPTTAPPVSPSPSAAPLSPAATSVEVLNQGGPAGAASAAADKLKAAGYTDVRVGNSPRRDIDGTVVYYKTSREAGDAVARVLGSSVTQVTRIPSSIDTTAEVLVLVGREPRRAVSSPRTAPRPNTPPPSPSPSPSPSDDVIVE